MSRRPEDNYPDNRAPMLSMEQHPTARIKCADCGAVFVSYSLLAKHNCAFSPKAVGANKLFDVPHTSK